MKIQELFEKSQTKEETRRIVGRWCELNPRLSIDKFVFGITGDVEEYKGEFFIYSNMLDNGIIPVKVKKCNELTILSSEIKSFLNLPDVIVKSFNGPFIEAKSLAGLSVSIGNTFYASDFKKLSLSNINKYIKTVEYIHCSDANIGPILSVLKIPSLKMLTTTAHGANQSINGVIDIVNYHLSTNRNILECQDELIENGFKEYAKL